MDVWSERATAAVLAGIGTFQALLAAGVPWAAASWGGRHRGVLPEHLRVASGAGAVAYFGAAGFIAGGRGRPDARSTAFAAISVWMGVGTIANALSPSRVERLIWTPTCAATTALAWRSRR